VLSKNRMRLKTNLKYSIISTLMLALAACGGQKSAVKPSRGHIEANSAVPSNPLQAKPINTPTAPIPRPVKNNIQLPVPKAAAKAQTYSVVVNEVPVKEILFALARESKMNVDIHPSIQGRATLNAVDQTLPAILERLAKQVDLTYKMDGNVLYISPDSPVLRSYKVDYVNMNRDTKSFIGADGQISSSSQVGGSTSTNGNGANNSSRTSVDSTSKNHLWESLIQNIKDLLAETDKEVLVSRIGTESATSNQASGQANVNPTNNTSQNAQVDVAKADAEQRERAKSEYKTLLAANVIANAETGVISVRATNKQHERVQEFIDKVMGSAQKQVLIEATIVEVRLSDSFQAGIDWSRLNNSASNSGFVFGQTLGSKGFSFNPNTGAIDQGGPNALGIATTAGLVAGYLNPLSAIGNISASISLLKQFGDTKVLSSPKLMVLNNQTAVLKVVDNLVYFTVQAQQSQATQGGVLSTITTTPNTVPVGVVMSVTPQINDSGRVNVNVRPTISRVLSFVRDPNPQLANIPSNIPQIQVREMESILQINSGNTAVLGGLMQDDIIRNSDKVPGLSEVPGVGVVFTGKNDATRKTELVIFLRPTVIPNASLESDELQSFKQYLPAQQLQNVLEEAN
jgi:MSHA biogenesis protein MshL